MQIRFELFSPEIISTLEKKELLSLFRIYRKNTTSAQMDGRITKDGPLYAGTLHLISLVFSWIGFEFLTKFGSKV